MTLLRRIIASTILATGLACCSKSAKVTFHALGDDGRPIAEAQISVSVFDHWQGGEGFGHDFFRSETVRTNASGEAVFQTSTSRGEMNFGVECAGYYRGGGEALHSHESSFGRWQPWNNTVEIRLRRVLHPIPLCARSVGTGIGKNSLPLPVLAQPVGFDLEASDWVTPHGKGKIADLLFRIDGATNDHDSPYDTTLTLTFSNPQDGVIIYPKDDYTNTEMPLPQLAPDTGYKPRILWRQTRSTNNTDMGAGCFFRVRTQTDAAGHITQAHYAKMTGPRQWFAWYVNGHVHFQYFFNPTPNDRNLEFAWGSNLLKVAKGEEPFRQ